MKQRSVFGWLMVGAFCASASCGGGSSGTAPVGFGLVCSSDDDCSKYQLLCGGNDKCVQCVSETDCKGKQVCAAGLCKDPQSCNDSRDCSGDQVCEDGSGTCVDCVTNRDCKTGQMCSKNLCVDHESCDFTSDCSGGLLCDATAHLCVECRTDTDCGLNETCADNACSSASGDGGNDSGGTGTGGKVSVGGGGQATAGTKSTGGTESGGTESGGTESGGTASGGIASGGTSGSAGKAGSAGAAGSGSTCDCTLGTVCTPDLRCVPPTLIDDLVDCDSKILSIEGRKGDWAAAADTGINIMHGFSDPGSGWIDHTCAAWAAGGELSLNNPNATFAFIGFRLDVNAVDTGLAYSLAAYSGLKIKLESDSSVQVVLKTTGGGYFQVTLAPVAGSNSRQAAFTSMLKMTNSAESFLDLTTVYEVQFSVTDPTSFGLAVHRVELY